MTALPKAIYRPERGDVLIIRDDGESFAIPENHALALADALREAFAIPAHADALLGAGGSRDYRSAV